MPPACPTFLLPARLPRAVAGLLALAAATAALAPAGCFYTDQGLAPPGEAFYYPTGLAISPGRTALYVANSDFDLLYNGGTVNVLDLRAMRSSLTTMITGLRCAQQAPDACATLGVPVSRAPTVEAVCQGFTFRQTAGGLGNGQPCAFAGDCASGVCDSTSVCRACIDLTTAVAENLGDRVCLSGTCGTADAARGVCVLDENTNQILTPAACTPMWPPFARNRQASSVCNQANAGGCYSFATIGAFASGAVLAVDPTPGAGARLFVPVRGDPSITWFDVDDDRVPPVSSGDVATLDCGQSPADPAARCGADHQMGTDPYDNLRDLSLPVQPVGLDVTDDGTALVSAHQIAGSPAVGLSVNDWGQCKRPVNDAAAGGHCPLFEFYLTANIPAGPMEVARIPVPRLMAGRVGTGACDANLPIQPLQPVAYQPGFLLTYNATPEVDLINYDDDACSSPPRPFITRGATTPVVVNADGKDSRGLVVDGTKRQTCEAACAATDLPCLTTCLDIPLDVFIANRAPSSLLLGRVNTVIAQTGAGGTGMGTAVFDVPEVYGTVSLSTGPSKVAIGKIIGPDGKLATRIFAVAFDTRTVFSYDPEAQQIDFSIRTGRGPHPIALDTCTVDGDGYSDAHTCGPDEAPHSLLYVGHFTDSYIGVVDLDMRHPETFGIMFASIGIPNPPAETQSQ